MFQAQTGQSNVSEPRSPPPIIRAMDRKGTDGWDTEEWGSLEEEPVAQSYSNNSIQELGTERISPPPPPSNLSSPSEGWAATEFAPVENSSAKSISTYNWDEGEGKDEFPELSNRVHGISKSQSGWEDTEWEPLGDASGASSRLEEARKKREEKKLLRQKELEARRATRVTGGPMKLGAKKV
ncbi:unnamed protein product [Timema podura]|uniref:Uncharacterized protein n=1 Tax=Timema podura TaxID=61482 RepID=A0ABN7NMS5_TIMPD|nr:unnamed protein product [Timema podura]